MMQVQRHRDYSDVRPALLKKCCSLNSIKLFLTYIPKYVYLFTYKLFTYTTVLTHYFKSQKFHFMEKMYKYMFSFQTPVEHLALPVLVPPERPRTAQSVVRKLIASTSPGILRSC